MSKNIVPCGGFELGESLIMKDGKLDANGDFIVTFTFDDSENIVSDKTFDEIFEAYKAGKKVSGLIVNRRDDWSILHISSVNGEEIIFFLITGTLIDGVNADVKYLVVQVGRIGGNLFYLGSLTAGAS